MSTDNKILICFVGLMFYIAVCCIATIYFIDHRLPNSPERPLIHEETCAIDHHEYQIELQFDTILIYDNNRFVGSYYITGDSLNQFETILADDNR